VFGIIACARALAFLDDVSLMFPVRFYRLAIP
jgi:hypothetical protein